MAEVSYNGVWLEVGDGWLLKIIHPLIKDLLAAGWSGKLNQVKEKFGGLRFYVAAGEPDEVYKLIWAAENASTTICEICGAPGELRYGGWIKTLCDEHHEAREAARITSSN